MAFVKMPELFSENHTVGELCGYLFEIRTGFRQGFGLPITQAFIDGLPLIVRLSAEQRIIDLGLNPNIGQRFRQIAEADQTLQNPLSDGMYYRALEGSVADIEFF